jgi:hypothetical protein
VFYFTKNHFFFSGTRQNVNGMDVLALMLLGVCWLKVKYFYLVLSFFFYKKSSFFSGTGTNVDGTNVMVLVLLKECVG